LGTGGGQSSPRASEHDPCRPLTPSHNNRRHRRRHSFELASRGNTHSAPTDCDSDHKRTSDRNAVALFTFNALVPETYAALLRFADWVWQGTLNALSASGDTIPGARKLTNVARQGFSGHHYVIMALCSMVASFLVNAFFAFATRPKDESATHLTYTAA
jgi:hypothetical protein